MLQLQHEHGVVMMGDETGLRFASCSGSTPRPAPQYADILNLPEHVKMFSTRYNEWRRCWLTSDFKREEVIIAAVLK
jgi:hypothetical protein